MASLARFPTRTCRRWSRCGPRAPGFACRVEGERRAAPAAGDTNAVRMLAPHAADRQRDSRRGRTRSKDRSHGCSWRILGLAQVGGRAAALRHCPDCQRAYPPHYDVCPHCWSALGAAPPTAPHQLALVLETNALFEADLLEELLRREGIPCVRVPCCIALSPGTGALTSCRL